MGLVARALEERGIATVIVGSALDIVAACGVPRFVFTDFPLGSPCGRPFDRDSQDRILGVALDLLGRATGPSTVRVPLRWSEDPSWKRDYASLAGLDPEERRRRRDELEAQKLRARRS